MAYKDPNDSRRLESRMKWYRKNKLRQLQRQLERKKERIALFNEYKRALQCSDCGVPFANNPEWCDFHHLDPKTKEPSDDRSMRKFCLYGPGVLQRELKKCIPLCSNCHRTRHVIIRR